MTDDIMPLKPEGLPGPLDAIQRALEQGALPETLERMMALQERWEATQARNAFNMAIARAKAEITPIVKTNEVVFDTARGGRTSYKYEALADIAAAVDPILSKYGLGYRYSSQTGDMNVSVTCILFHSQGHSEQTTLTAALDNSGSKSPIQSLGSALTYLSRYGLKLILGLSAARDDDGQAAGNGVNAPRTIDATQRLYLADMIEDAGETDERLEKFLRVTDLDTITQAQFSEAKAALLRKIAKNKEQPK